ncbi:hypothetical protein [Kribbella flavida]|uniref:DUF7878 domain-containing protein n=1 Tax=Kribbella flavida TaxID=182640 RepID=UPI0006744F7E|nr:hypothetical protein [Kribbella flavida]
MVHHDVSARDLQGQTLADYLVNIEADFEIIDGRQEVYSEPSFPVAELARELARWAAPGGSPPSPFQFSSLSFENPGAVTITPSSSGWVISSAFTPDRQSSPVSWAEVAACIHEFVDSVKVAVAQLGIDPERVLS